MDALPELLEKLDGSSPADLEKHLGKLIDLIDERYNDEEDDVHIAVVESKAIQAVLPFLKATDNLSLTAKTAQLFAELAKTESVRVPLVKLGVVPPLVELLKTQNVSVPVATQVCRALGNICFDNDVGRTAVNEREGIGAVLDLLRDHVSSTQEGAARLRVIGCGFVLNLTNECELLQEKALEAGVLHVLTQCLQQHPRDTDLAAMALATFLSVADSEAGKAQMLNADSNLLDTLVGVVSQDDGSTSMLPVLELLNSLAESELVKSSLADSVLPSHLLQVIQKNSSQQESDIRMDEHVKLASDLLLSLLVGDGSMEKLYGGGEGAVFKESIRWLEADKDGLRILGALAIGNFARSDAHCKQLADSGIVESLLMALKSSGGDDANFTLQHAILSSLRNLAIPASNKTRLLESGVVEIVLDLKHTEVMAVAFKLLGVLRMLMDGQEAAAISLGQERDFINCLVDWCAVEEHAGVKGEATRLMASMIKNSRSSQVMRNLVRAEGISHLVAMAMSEHVVMQNEALVALNLVVSTVLAEAAVSLREADLVGTVAKILKAEEAPPELLCNTLTLVRTISSTDNLKQDMVTTGLVDQIRELSQGHSRQEVKDAAISALASLEEGLAR